MRKIVFDDPRVGPWVAEQTGIPFAPGPMSSLGMLKDDKLVGGVIYREFTDASCEVSVAGTGNWITRDMLFRAFDYPFNVCGLTKLFGRTRSDNYRALAFDAKIGWALECVIPGVFSDADLYVLSMRKEDCRWLKLRPRGSIENRRAA